jgi:hypothetical protein
VGKAALVDVVEGFEALGEEGTGEGGWEALGLVDEDEDVRVGGEFCYCEILTTFFSPR